MNIKNHQYDELRGAIRQASRWYARLQSSSTSAADRHAWQQWLNDAPSHQLAWQQVEQLQADMAKMPSEIVSPALRGAELSRRDVLRSLGIFVFATPVLGVVAWQLKPWQRWQAEYVTAIGEQRSLTLADGTELILNTASSVDISYDQHTRLIKLHRGEILVRTSSDPQSPPRPLLVATPQGRIEALGTRFTVQTDDDRTQVSVLEKRVRIHPACGESNEVINQGDQTSFTKAALSPVTAASPFAASWSLGSLTVVDMPLGQLLQELSRYRSGMVSCSPDIAQLKISGAFPLNDTDRALAVITRAFPVEQKRLTRYWVRLVAA